MILAKKYLFIFGCVLVFGIFCLLGIVTQTFENRQKPNEMQDLFEMSLEELMELEVTYSSKKTTSMVIVNSKSEAVNLISMNLQLDVSEWLGLKKGQSHFIFKVENLFDDDIYVPTLAYTGSPNSFPYNAGRTFYVGLKINF